MTQSAIRVTPSLGAVHPGADHHPTIRRTRWVGCPGILDKARPEGIRGRTGLGEVSATQRTGAVRRARSSERAGSRAGRGQRNTTNGGSTVRPNRGRGRISRERVRSASMSCWAAESHTLARASARAWYSTSYARCFSSCSLRQGERSTASHSIKLRFDLRALQEAHASTRFESSSVPHLAIGMT